MTLPKSLARTFGLAQCNSQVQNITIGSIHSFPQSRVEPPNHQQAPRHTRPLHLQTVSPFPSHLLTFSFIYFRDSPGHPPSLPQYECSPTARWHRRCRPVWAALRRHSPPERGPSDHPRGKGPRRRKSMFYVCLVDRTNTLNASLGSSRRNGRTPGGPVRSCPIYREYIFTLTLLPAGRTGYMALGITRSCRLPRQPRQPRMIRKVGISCSRGVEPRSTRISPPRPRSLCGQLSSKLSRIATSMASRFLQTEACSTSFRKRTYFKGFIK